MTKAFEFLIVCPYCGYKRNFYTKSFQGMVVLKCKYSTCPPVEGDALSGGCEQNYVLKHKLVPQLQVRAIDGENEDPNGPDEY